MLGAQSEFDTQTARSQNEEEQKAISSFRTSSSDIQRYSAESIFNIQLAHRWQCNGIQPEPATDHLLPMRSVIIVYDFGLLLVVQLHSRL